MSIFENIKFFVYNLLVLLAITQYCNASTKTWFPLKPTEPRIINGTLVEAGTANYQVSVRFRLNDGYFFGAGHACGGSLIASNVVLTAAHCFVNNTKIGTYASKDDYIVVAGNLDRFENNNNTLVFDILELVLPTETFNATTYETDIALLILNASIPIRHPTVQPVEIAQKAVPNNIICQVTGWGQTEESYLSDFLMTVDVPIMSNEACKNDTLFPPELIMDGMVCAGYLEGERDACSGDSGGPMVCSGIQAGIVSWGNGCALPKYPGIYTNVTYYAPWIKENLQSRNISLYKAGNAAFNTKASIKILGLLTIVCYLFNKFYIF